MGMVRVSFLVFQGVSWATDQAGRPAEGRVCCRRHGVGLAFSPPPVNLHHGSGVEGNDMQRHTHTRQKAQCEKAACADDGWGVGRCVGSFGNISGNGQRQRVHATTQPKSEVDLRNGRRGITHAPTPTHHHTHTHTITHTITPSCFPCSSSSPSACAPTPRIDPRLRRARQPPAPVPAAPAMGSCWRLPSSRAASLCATW